MRSAREVVEQYNLVVWNQRDFALAEELMGDDKLKVIATELVLTVRKNVSIDWTLRENARARIRVIVKRILKKFGYPPDLQDEAVKLVLEQAETLSDEWAVAN